MSKFNFDSEFFRNIISKNEKTIKVPYLSHILKEAIEVFYDEYDYYPDIAAYAPGTFTIMGDHLEYVKGNLVQAALPLGTVVVGKSLCSVKCKLVTTSKNVKGLKKSIFSIFHYKKNLKVFPEWVNYIKGREPNASKHFKRHIYLSEQNWLILAVYSHGFSGVINSFPVQDIQGFDAVIHSSVPFGQGYGSSAALQVGFYTFLETAVGLKSYENKAEKGNLCHMAETQSQPSNEKIGKVNNFTSSVAMASTGVRINCRTKDVSIFDMREINILFLLTYPNFEIELNDRDCIFQRELELKLAAKLLGLEEIIDAKNYHLDVLRNMEDPTKDTVKEILREFCTDEQYLEKFVEDLFNFPKPESIPEVNSLFGEDQYQDRGESALSLAEVRQSGNNLNQEILQDQQEKEEPKTPCLGLKSDLKWTPKPLPPAVSYTQQRILELCEGTFPSQNNLPQAICDEINCLGGLDNLSAASDMNLCGRLLRRVRHVITENLRSLSLSDLTSQVDYEEFGTKLIQSHLSLKLDFEVSCPTLDGLVQLAIDFDRVYGAKMTSGGGTLTLLHRSVVGEFIDQLIEKFGNKFYFYLVFPSSGARTINMGIKNNPRSTLSDVFLNQDELLRRSIDNFQATYKYKPTHGAYSPAILNLLGEHADYNHGICLAVAINLMMVVVGAYNGTSKIRAATTVDVGTESPKTIFSILETENEVRKAKVKWANVFQGVLSYFKDFLKGFDCLIDSNLPYNFGIVSKPTLVMAFYTFMEELTGQRCNSAAQKAHECMLILQEFNNSVTGVGENTVAIRSKDDFAVFFDSRSVVTTLIPFQNPSVTLLLTFVEVEKMSNQAKLFRRMEECYKVAKALGGKTLRCLTLKDLDALKDSKKKVNEKSILRAEYVITENERVLKAMEALKNNDYQALGELMVHSHNSLRDKYEMVDPKMDRLVASAMEVDGVLGSKMSSFGSRTCIISLVKRWAVDDLIEYLQNSVSYKLIFYLVNSYKGCNMLNVKEAIEKLPSTQFTFEDIFPF